MFWSLIGRKCIMWLKIIRLESLYYVIFSPEANSKFPDQIVNSPEQNGKNQSRYV